MKIKNVSPCIITDKIDATREFYTEKLGAKLGFDCGWYIDVLLDGTSTGIQFMSPQSPEQKLCNPAGLTYNIMVDDVDKELEGIMLSGVSIASDISDKPWGDRSFIIEDPNGISLYIYSLREASTEFKKYFKYFK